MCSVLAKANAKPLAVRSSEYGQAPRRWRLHLACAISALLAAAIPAFPQTALAQNSPDGLWSPVAPDETEAASAPDERVPPSKRKTFNLDLDAMKSRLQRAAPSETTEAAATPVEISVPLPNGTFQRFEIIESDVAAPELSRKFPELKSYTGRSLDGERATIAIDVSPEGFSAQVRAQNETFVISPSKIVSAPGSYVTFNKGDYKRQLEEKRCLVPPDETAPARAAPKLKKGKPGSFRSGGTLRTYRLAMAATGEYTAFHLTVEKALAAIRRTVNRINQIYQSELSIRFELVADNDKIIFTDAVADGFNNDDADELIGQSQRIIDERIKDANYDVGHTLSTGAGGLAQLGVVGQSGTKAMGVTGSQSPVDDPFDVDYVAHELGHQFGANHTFNGVSGSCSGDNRNAPTAYEPGSGITILGYAGICGDDNITPHSSPYFHFASLEEITAVISAPGQPPGKATGNTPPVVKAKKPAAEIFVIPRATPFFLDAEATDADGDPIDITWEEADLGPARLLGEPDVGKGPLFRSVQVKSGTFARFIPQEDGVLSGTWPKDEVTPVKRRELNFRVTARDRKMLAGAVASDSVTVSVVDTAGPFKITEPKNVTQPSRSMIVKWEVGSTDQPPIKVRKVDIYLSGDGGKTFPVALAKGAANNGSKQVTLPASAGNDNLRIKVQASDNIFFAVSPVTFKIAGQ